MKRKMLFMFSLTVAAFIILTGCPSIKEGATPPGEVDKTPAAKAVKKEGTELARVGDYVITKEEFDGRLEKIPPFYKKRVATKEGKMEFLDRMIMEELYYQEALRRGLDADQEYIDQIEAMKKSLLSGKVRKAALEEDVSPTDVEIQEYYDNNADEFKIPEKATVKHILVKVSRKATPEEKDKARKKIDEAYKKLKQGAKFEDVTMEYSEDRHSAKKGGEIPAVRKGVKSKEFDEVAFSMTKPEQISDVFEDRRGFNILQFVSKEEASLKEFDKVERQIRRKLENEKRKDMLNNFTEELKTKANIVINEDLLIEEEAEPEARMTESPLPTKPGEEEADEEEADEEEES